MLAGHLGVLECVYISLHQPVFFVFVVFFVLLSLLSVFTLVIQRIRLAERDSNVPKGVASSGHWCLYFCLCVSYCVVEADGREPGSCVAMPKRIDSSHTSGQQQQFEDLEQKEAAR